MLYIQGISSENGALAIPHAMEMPDRYMVAIKVFSKSCVLDLCLTRFALSFLRVAFPNS